MGLLILFGSFYVGWHWTNRDIRSGKYRESSAMNRLAREKSPYLLQHKDNPVDWYAWGPEAFEAAKRDNKLIFLSIGYSTCHWCHVMEHDSFETQEVAEILNRHFISIKVDREERPDVDQVYMDAVVQMTGQGGWPLTVFLTPDLKPFFGATFFWKDQFIRLLANIQNVWEKEPQKITETGEELVGHLKTLSLADSTAELDLKAADKAVGLFKKSFDAEHGGFGGAPKFPRSIDLSFLMRVHQRTSDAEALSMVTRTLDAMAYGGLYDHLGGGFHRYSTDARWLVPHFEKMLYDNALLALTYLEAHQATGKGLYAQVAREILDYVRRDMTDARGGFHSAEDADSEGEEGKFYVWSADELRRLLTPEEFSSVERAYGVTDAGNFEGGTNILNLTAGYEWSIKQSPLMKSAREKLFAAREKRVHPHKDDKILTDWNGLMIAAMAKAYSVLGDEAYLKAARDSARFLRKTLWRDGRLLHRYRDGDAAVDGFLNDYAYLIAGLIALYQADFDETWLEWAQELQAVQDQRFWDASRGGYYFAPEGGELFVRNKEFNDGAIPAANSLSALNLSQLYGFTLKKEYDERARKTLASAGPYLLRHPPAYSTALVALEYRLGRPREVAVIGKKNSPDTQALLAYLRESFLPNQVLAFKEEGGESRLPVLQNRTAIGGRATVYVCESHTCKAPVSDLEALQKLLKN